jgi:hypothetical protein
MTETLPPSEAFTDGRRLQRKDGEATLTQRTRGKLTVTSGKLAACDPFVGAYDVPPFARAVPRGEYDVDVSILSLPNGDRRVAFARLRVAPGTPVRWENAAHEGNAPENRDPGEIYGYPVDAGTGCFADLTTLRAFDQCGEDASDELLQAMDKTQENTWSWGNITCGDAGENLLAFSSGWGDGFYASYWGIDENGAAVCIVTDFGVCDVDWGPGDP